MEAIASAGGLRYFAIIGCLLLGTVCGCHTGLDGGVVSKGLSYGDFMLPVGGPTEEGGSVAAGGQSVQGGDEAGGDRQGDATGEGDGVVGGDGVARGDDREAGEGPAADDAAPGAADGAGDALAPESDDAQADPRVTVSAFTCFRQPNDLLCIKHADRIESPVQVAVIDWRLENVSAAYMRIRSLDQGDASGRFSYTQFIGDIGNRYIGVHSDAVRIDEHFTMDLLSDPLAGYERGLSEDQRGAVERNRDQHPFSFCETNTDVIPRSCFDGHRDVPAADIIFFPLRRGERSLSGRWLLRINGTERSFEVAFLGLDGRVRTERVSIAGTRFPIVRIGPGDPRQVEADDEIPRQDPYGDDPLQWREADVVRFPPLLPPQ